MSKSIRVRTTPGDNSEKYVKIKLEQDFDFLELLSLKIDQKDVYQSFCSDYGVIAGRVIINGGFGVPNTKVSIFIPIDSIDIDNELISKIYPYETPNADEKNDNGIRYNLLPNTQQTLDHNPVGTFPEKREILDNTVTFEVYEKYYKYTTTTNKAGDFILFGIPVGTHLLHYDMDLSDIGFLSARPYELIEQGAPKADFENNFKFKSSPDLAKLPQIISSNMSVNIEPYWCDDLSTGRVMGINRQDILIQSAELIPSAIFFGSIFSDDEADSVNKNCRPRRSMGQMKEVITGGGRIEAIRRTPDGKIENYALSNSEIDQNGNWSVLIPMNMRKVITDEFGELVPSNDSSKGVATESDLRFKISMDPGNNDKRLRQRASFLVPNMTSNYFFKPYSKKDLKSTPDWRINTQLSTFTIGTPYQNDLFNEYNYIEDFYTLRWKKVYTIKQYIGRYQGSNKDETRAFTGIKDITNAEGVNKFPTNRMDSSIHPLYWFLCFMLTLFAMLVGLINSIINQINGIITFLCQIQIPCSLEVCSGSCLVVKKFKYAARRPAGCCAQALGTCGYCKKQLGGSLPDSGTIALPGGGTWSVSGCNAGGYHDYRWTKTKITKSTSWPYATICTNQEWKDESSDCDRNAAFKAVGNKSTNTYGSCTGGGSTSVKNYCLHLWNRNIITYKGTGPNCSKSCPADCPEPPAIKVNLGVVCFCLGIKIINFCLLTNMFCRKCRSLCPGKEKFSCCDEHWKPSDSCTCTPSDDNVKYGKCEDGSSGCISKCRSATCKYNPGSYRKDDSNKYAWCKIKRKFRDSSHKTTQHGFCDPRKCGCGQRGSDDDSDDKGKGSPATFYLGGGEKCCKDCCGKVPLIRLDCDEDASFLAIAPIVLIPTIFAAGTCNETYIFPWSCISCGGFETPYIKDWVGCKLEALAGALNMLKFDFYNDWVNGALYFPLFKRKYKVKKNKKKQGRIKKDKFCDYDCDEFQGSRYCKAYAIKLKNVGPRFVISEPMEGDMYCSANIRRSYKFVTKWYGGHDEVLGRCLNASEAQDLAIREIYFVGTDTNNNPCRINVRNYTHLNDLTSTYSNLKDKVKDKKIGAEHGKPQYVKTEDTATGLDTWENIGGHSHHKNKCNTNYLHERGEYFKEVMDCKTRNERADTPQGYVFDLEADDPDFQEDDDTPAGEDFDIDNVKGQCDNESRCDTMCGADGVGACTIFCQGNSSGCKNDNYNKDIRHGIIKWVDGNLFYASKILPGDKEFNATEYKANLFYPTDLSELGSSTYCDIDEIPFVMDTLVPTTFQVSEDKLKVRTKEITEVVIQGVNDGNPILPIEIKSIKEENKSKINIRAYAEFSCLFTKCMNIFGGAVQSQLGVDIMDSNDLGMQTRQCFLRFEHDEDVREYFCRRFSGYKDNQLNVNYMRPGSPQFDNTYKTYSEIVVKDGEQGDAPIWYLTPEGEYIESLYNEGDPFIPGDRCGLSTTNNLGVLTNVDYFYAVAPGQTPNLINFPNSTIPITDASAANVDYISDELVGVQKGVKYSRTQTPYYFYFGLVAGSTALHKVVSDFFADKINLITLVGVGDNAQAAGTKNNVPPSDKKAKSVNQVFKTCLGETLEDN